MTVANSICLFFWQIMFCLVPFQYVDQNSVFLSCFHSFLETDVWNWIQPKTNTKIPDLPKVTIDPWLKNLEPWLKNLKHTRLKRLREHSPTVSIKGLSILSCMSALNLEDKNKQNVIRGCSLITSDFPNTPL